MKPDDELSPDKRGESSLGAGRKDPVAAYVQEEKQRERIAAVLSRSRAPASPDISSSWRTFRRAAASARVVVLMLPDLRIREDSERVATFRRRFPHLPVVLVTRPVAAHLRRLAAVEIDEVVWVRDLEEELPPAVERALLKVPEESLLQAITAESPVSEHLEEALRAALLADPPLTSVTSWAARLEISPETLRYHWRKLKGDHGLQADLKDVLSLILLRRAIQQKPGITWDAAARKVGVHPTTLRRTARRLTGRTLSDLKNVSPPALDYALFGRLHDI